ncbi:MAG: matrixin family metalloprotease [Candidatus Nitrosotenuis sp.]|nr:MAG: matrixin family metalloprotease [Candidatus Nitrosotenuis sp.]
MKHRILLTTGAIVGIALIIISLLFSFKFSFSSNEEKIIPMTYASLFFVPIPIALGLFFLKKRISSKSKSEQVLSGKTSSAQDKIASIERQIQNLETKNKKNSIIIVLGIVVLAGVLVAYSSLNFIERPTQQILSSGRFIVENLKGDTIKIWVTWHIPKDVPLQVTIINSPDLPDERINAIKEAIVSEKTLALKNVFLNKESPSEKSTYYEGWRGALKSIAEQKTEFNIPTNFVVTTSEKSIGDVIIILSTAKEADGTYAFTRTIADDGANQILKSFITVFDVESLNNEELAAVIRHEFGHAMGLAHSTAEEDLMYPTFYSNRAFISECDLDAMLSLYSGSKSAEVVCRH